MQLGSLKRSLALWIACVVLMTDVLLIVTLYDIMKASVALLPGLMAIATIHEILDSVGWLYFVWDHRGAHYASSLNIAPYNRSSMW
jgi:hypothetical protein